MAQRDVPNSNRLKYMSLVVLTFQNAVLILSMRYSRVVAENVYYSTTAVVLSETLKVLICLVVIRVQQQDFLQHLYDAIVVKWKDTLKLSVPAVVYMVQNNLQYVAVSNLEAAEFQVLYQLKILTTALFSVAMLKKKLSFLQWLSLLILFAGAAIVQLQEIKPTTNVVHAQSKWVGLIAVIVSCVSSGFAGVYFEMVLKESDTSIWMRNVQLGIFGSSTALISMFVKDGPLVMKNGFFYGYSVLVWSVVVQQAVGGLIVAMVVCYADNILKGFATSLSIILSCIASIYLFRYSITLQFAFGALLVIAAVYLYSYPPPKPKPAVIAPGVGSVNTPSGMKAKTYSLPNVLSKE